ncbi:hypothetical protein [Moorena bouillonii]|nr:hypothetical protein [Moorena bouillonii]
MTTSYSQFPTPHTPHPTPHTLLPKGQGQSHSSFRGQQWWAVLTLTMTL